MHLCISDVVLFGMFLNFVYIVFCWNLPTVYNKLCECNSLFTLSLIDGLGYLQSSGVNCAAMDLVHVPLCLVQEFIQVIP